MSLLTEQYEPFRIMDKTTTPDSYGGVITVWVEGAEIEAVLTPDGGVEQLTAQQRGWTGSYTVITPRTIMLMDNDVIKRVSDSKVFRIKSDGTDNKTPRSAGLDMRSVKAEDYTL